MKISKVLASCALFVFLLPLSVFANVKINEIAWMGNDKSQYGEWVELYNDATAPVDLKGAALYEDGGRTLIIKLTKSVTPNSYYLIARSTPSMPDPVGGLADDLGSFGGSGLSNSGEYLVLKSAEGVILDSIDATSGWPAGDAATKQTMQRDSSKWVTATATPRVPNTFINTVSVSTVNSTETVDNNSSAKLSSHSSQAEITSKKEELKIFASAGRDRLALVDTPITFEEKLFNNKNENIDGGNISWSFGDGQLATGDTVVHTYKFPGDYVVVMNVLRDAENYVDRTNVSVVPASIEIADVTPNFLKIKNLSVHEANLGGWQLASPEGIFTFPKDTIVLPKKEVVFSKEVTGLVSNSEQSIKLLSPAGNAAFIFTPRKNEPTKSEVSMRLEVATSSNESLALFLMNAEKKLLKAKMDLALITQKPGLIPNKNLRQVASVADSAVFEGKTRVDRPETIEVIEKPKSFLSSLLNLPVNGLRYIKSFFF